MHRLGSRDMAKTDQEDTYSEAETVARREAALKRAFATPHKPHKAKGGKPPKEKPDASEDSVGPSKVAEGLVPHRRHPLRG